MGKRINVQLIHEVGHNLETIRLTANSSAENFPITDQLIERLNELNGQPSAQLTELLMLEYPKTEGNHQQGDRAFYLNEPHPDADVHIVINMTSVKVSDPKAEFFTKVTDLIHQVDPSVTVAEEFLEKTFSGKAVPWQAVEFFFALNPLCISKLQPLKGQCGPNDIKKITRPYIALSDASYDALMKADADFYQTLGGQLVTMCKATCFKSESTYALAPYMPEYADKILPKQAG